MKAWRLKALLAAMALQLLVLGGELLGAVYPHWTGEPVRLAIEPIDPRSLFRGNYVRLNYAINTIEMADGERFVGLRQNEIVYVRLKPDAEGILQPDGVFFEPPGQGPFIRGRLRYVPFTDDGVARLHIVYGIEAYFLPLEKAREMEELMRQRRRAVATVMLAPNGKAAIAGVEISDLPAAADSATAAQ